MPVPGQPQRGAKRDDEESAGIAGGRNAYRPGKHSKATRLRRRISATPPTSASFFSRCSSAVRNASAVSYFTIAHPPRQSDG